MDMLEATKNADLHSMLKDYLYLYCTDNLPDALTQKVSLAHSLIHSPYSLTHSLTHLLTYLLTYLLTHSLTHSPTHSLTYSLTYILTYSLKLNIDDCTTIITKINECVMQLFVQCSVAKVEDTTSRSWWWISLCGDISGTVRSQISASENR